MKKIIVLLGIVLVFVHLSCRKKTEEKQETTQAHSSNTGIKFFEGNFAQAQAKAKAENKLIFMDAYASWCGPCKMMQNTAFPDEQVGKLYNQKFINVAYDMEVGEGLELATKYPIEGYPTLFFINGDGKVVNSYLGGRDAAGLLELANAN